MGRRIDEDLLGKTDDEPIGVAIGLFVLSLIITAILDK